VNKIFLRILLFVLIFSILHFTNPTTHQGETFGLGSIGALPVGFIVWAIGLSLGGTTGYAKNPARDLGPRIFLSFILGSEPFLTNESFWWIPIVGPLLGGIISSIVYFTFIEAHWPVANLNSLSPDVNTKKDEAEL
jgi:glycerol uptake facilitator protein